MFHDQEEILFAANVRFRQWVQTKVEILAIFYFDQMWTETK